MSQSPIPIFEKLVALHARFPKIVIELSRLAHETEKFQPEMDSIEKYLQALPSDKPQPDPDLTIEASKKILVTAKKFLFVRDTLLREPLFSVTLPAVILDLARMADIQPAIEPANIVTSRDWALVRAVQMLIELPSLNPEDILNESIEHIVAVFRLSPDIVAKSYNVSLLDDWESGQDWASQMKAVEDSLDPPVAGSTPSPALSAQATDLRQTIISLGLSAEQLKSLLSPPRFSRMLGEEFSFLAEQILDWFRVQGLPPVQRTTPNLKSLIEHSAKTGTSSEPVQETIDRISRRLSLRIEIGKRIQKLRLFAKRDALVHRWPKLTKILYEGGGRMLQLEQLATGNLTTPSPEIQEIWDANRTDETLLKLLRLQPLLGESAESLSKHDLREAESVISRTAQLVDESSETSQAVSGQPSITVTEPPSISDLFFTLSEEGGKYKIEIKVDDTPKPVPSELTSGAFDAFLNRWRPKDSAQTGSGDVNDGSPDRLKQMGTALYDVVFKGDLEEILLRAFKVSKSADSSRLIRVNLDIQSPQLTQIPWECLYVPKLADFWALIPYATINRYIALDISDAQPVRSLAPAVSVFALLSERAGSHLYRQEEESLRRSLAKSSLFDLHVEYGLSDIAESVAKQVRESYPVILHILASASVEDENTNVASVPLGNNSVAQPVARIAQLIQELGIRIVVYHADLGSQRTNVARQFLNAGAQCVVAATGRLESRSIPAFTSGFYQALADGFNVERAMVEARRSLHSKERDWTPYALFTSCKDLGALRVESPNVK